MSVGKTGERLFEWLRPIDFNSVATADGAIIISSSGGEIRWYIRVREGNVLVTTEQRAGSERPKMMAAQVVDVERYVTVELGRSVRDAVVPRLSRMSSPLEREGLAEGFDIVRAEDGDLSAILLEGGVERARFTSFESPREAVFFSHYANASLTDIKASLLDPRGQPALSSFVEE